MKTISVAELKAKLAANEDFLLLDVRQPEEYAESNLDGLLIPLAELPQRVSELDPHKQTIVHCKAGGRSAKAVEYLESQGFVDVYNLTGGILAWQELQLENNS